MRLLTQKDAAALLNVSVSTIYRLRLDGHLATVRPTKRMVRIPEESIILLRNKKWEKSHLQDCCQIGRETNTRTIGMVAANEKVYGQMIYSSPRRGSRAG